MQEIRNLIMGMKARPDAGEEGILARPIALGAGGPEAAPQGDRVLQQNSTR